MVYENSVITRVRNWVCWNLGQTADVVRGGVELIGADTLEFPISVSLGNPLSTSITIHNVATVQYVILGETGEYRIEGPSVEQIEHQIEEALRQFLPTQNLNKSD